MYFYANEHDFLISDKPISPISERYELVENANKIFGYCFLNNSHFKNEDIESAAAELIRENNVDASGVYCCVSIEQRSVKLCFDPMLQFNLFVFKNESRVLLSSSLDMLIAIIGKNNLSFSEDYLFDQFAYQSPMRGATLFNEVTLFTFDDLKLSNTSFPDTVTITKPSYGKYSELSYDTLLGMYIERLNQKAAVISSKFEEVHIQLTGGADSRLVLSAFQRYDNTFAYVYGDGGSQNRLVFEELVRARHIKKVEGIHLVGKPLSSPELVCQGLIDSNFLKFNNLNTYMNGPLKKPDSICKVTGYYGANVCGGVVLPPEYTSSNTRLVKIPREMFTYQSYVNDFKLRNSSKRNAAFSDLFYINNRGKGHYASHTLADNKNINSVDILYDYLNLLLVEKCPYSDEMIDKNAISIDLIHINDPQLALFPYDSRKIPKYRHFNNIPLINCFDGYNFPRKELESFKVTHPKVSTDLNKLFEGFEKYGSTQEMLSLKAFDHIFERYPCFLYLRESNDIQAMIFLYYCMSVVYVENNY